jgi:hypothetical protein
LSGEVGWHSSRSVVHDQRIVAGDELGHVHFLEFIQD